MGAFDKIPWKSEDEYKWLEKLGTLDERIKEKPAEEQLEYRRACLQGYIDGHPLSGHAHSMQWAKEKNVHPLVSLTRARRLLESLGV